MASIETVISKPIWDAIKDNYEKGSYTTAISNLLIFIQDVVREKSGLELDGTNLIERAFFGDKPLLLVNKYETRTEKDIQYGIGNLLKGLCQAIRNPRAHERYNDDKMTADRIIYFVDYIFGFIQNTKYGSLVEDWLDLLFDRDFIGDTEYLDELYKQLPKKTQLDLLINIFRKKENVKSSNTVKFIKLIIEGLNEKEQESLFSSISRDLMALKNDLGLREFLYVFPPELWNKIEKLPRLQIEGKIKDCFRNATVEYEQNYDEYYTNLNEAALVTINSLKHIKYFSENNKSEIIDIIINYLTTDDYRKKNLILDILIDVFDYFEDCLTIKMATAISKFISHDKKMQDDRMSELLHRKIKIENNPKWKDLFETNFDMLILGKELQKISQRDDIPF